MEKVHEIAKSDDQRAKIRFKRSLNNHLANLNDKDVVEIYLYGDGSYSPKELENLEQLVLQIKLSEEATVGMVLLAFTEGKAMLITAAKLLKSLEDDEKLLLRVLDKLVLHLDRWGSYFQEWVRKKELA